MFANDFRYSRIILVFFCQLLEGFLSKLAVLNDGTLDFLLPLPGQANINFASEVLTGIGVMHKYLDVFRNRTVGERRARYRQASNQNNCSHPMLP